MKASIVLSVATLAHAWVPAARWSPHSQRHSRLGLMAAAPRHIHTSPRLSMSIADRALGVAASVGISLAVLSIAVVGISKHLCQVRACLAFL